MLFESPCILCTYNYSPYVISLQARECVCVCVCVCVHCSYSEKVLRGCVYVRMCACVRFTHIACACACVCMRVCFEYPVFYDFSYIIVCVCVCVFSSLLQRAPLSFSRHTYVIPHTNTQQYLNIQTGVVPKMNWKRKGKMTRVTCFLFTHDRGIVVAVFHPIFK